MRGATDLDAQLHGANGAHSQAQQAPKSCWSRNWPRAFLLLSIAVAALTFTSVILNLVRIVISPNAVLLNVYCLVFSLLTLSAELRQFQWTRKVSYHWMKYVYFLTYYKPRGVFYILLGFLLLGDTTLLYIAGAASIFVGLVMLVTSFVCALPVYDDPQERRRELEDARRYYEGVAARRPTALQRRLGLGDTETGAAGGNDLAGGSSLLPTHFAAQEQSTAPGSGQYQPPVLPLSEDGTQVQDGSRAGRVSSSAHTSDVFVPQGMSAAMFDSSNNAAVFAEQVQATGGSGLGESALRREFAAAMREDVSLR